MLALVVVAHPSTDSYCHALAARAQSGLSAAGHEVIVLDSVRPGVPSRDDGAGARGVPRRLARFSIRWSQSTPPRAARRGGRVRVPDVVERPAGDPQGLARAGDGARRRIRLRRAHGKVRPGLTHVRRLVGISTYGSPRAYVRFVNDNGRRIITRALRMSAGRASDTRWLALYAIDTSTPTATRPSSSSGRDDRWRAGDRASWCTAIRRRRLVRRRGP